MCIEHLCIVVRNITCARAVDIVLVLDQSSSIVIETFDNWDVQVLGFAKRIAGSFLIGRHQTQIGLVKFSDEIEIVFHLNTYGDRQSVLDAIGNVDISGGDTNIAAALRTAREMMFTEQNGSRPEVPKILILLTDGTANIELTNTLPEADLTKAANITIYTVGVTHKVDENQLRVVASIPDYFFFASDFTQLSNVVGQVVENSCRGAPTYPTTTTTNTTTIFTATLTMPTTSTTTTAATTSTATTIPMTTTTTTRSTTATARGM